MEQIYQCKKCKKEFIPKYINKPSLFCSPKCRQKDWVENNRDRHNEAVRKHRAKRYKEEGQWYNHSPKAKSLRNWMIEIKSKPCTDCKNTFDTCCMDFDHRIDSEKSYNLGTMFAHHYSRELIEKELEKCDLVCTNCHRIRTKNKRIGNGKYKI